MYKYLSDRITEPKGATPLIGEMVLISFEIHKESKSDLMSDFESLEYSKICEVLGWKDLKKTHNAIAEAIDDESFVGFLFQNNKTGFIANVLIPVCYDIKKLAGAKVPNSWSSSEGHCYSIYIYAESVGELTELALKKSQEFFIKDFKQNVI